MARTQSPRPGGLTSGHVVAVTAVLFIVGWLAFLLLASPRLQDQLGIGPSRPAFDPPPSPVAVDIAEGPGPGEAWEATARWDPGGACADLVFASGPRTRTCAVPDPLQPIWAVEVPDGPVPVLVLATAQEVAVVEIRLVGGDILEREPVGVEEGLPAGFAAVELPAGGRVEEIGALAASGAELAVATCGGDAGDPLGGGCAVPLD